MYHFKPLTEKYEWDWIFERACPLWCKDTQGIVAYDENGNIQAVTVMDSWTDNACQVHFAIDKPLVIKHGFLNECFRHVFITCKRKRVFGLIPSDNDRAHKLDLHIGFTEVARIPHGYSEEVDYIVVGMPKDECRWLAEHQTVEQRIKRAA